MFSNFNIFNYYIKLLYYLFISALLDYDHLLVRAIKLYK